MPTIAARSGWRAAMPVIGMVSRRTSLARALRRRASEDLRSQLVAKLAALGLLRKSSGRTALIRDRRRKPDCARGASIVSRSATSVSAVSAEQRGTFRLPRHSRVGVEKTDTGSRPKPTAPRRSRRGQQIWSRGQQPDARSKRSKVGNAPVWRNKEPTDKQSSRPTTTCNGDSDPDGLALSVT
jgi:hypothetical protein